ncbi:MAG TPA: hypothetical protein VGO31_14615 [Microbacteriaceae bacterium]|nr:hypothetical protein [Microbacteriaceae bacterium]
MTGQLKAEREQIDRCCEIVCSPDEDGHRRRAQLAQLRKLLRRSAEIELQKGPDELPG